MPDKKPLAPTNKDRRFIDEQTNKRIHEHLTNESDRVSEEDIRNVKTDFSYNSPDNGRPTDTERSRIGKEKGKKGKKKIDENADTDQIKDNSDPEIETSWNILES